MSTRSQNQLDYCVGFVNCMLNHLKQDIYNHTKSVLVIIHLEAKYKERFQNYSRLSILNKSMKVV